MQQCNLSWEQATERFYSYSLVLLGLHQNPKLAIRTITQELASKILSSSYITHQKRSYVTHEHPQLLGGTHHHSAQVPDHFVEIKTVVKLFRSDQEGRGLYMVVNRSPLGLQTRMSVLSWLLSLSRGLETVVKSGAGCHGCTGKQVSCL